MGNNVAVTGKVVRIESDYAWVELPRQLGCARCETGQGCGAGTLVKLFSRKAIRIKIALDAEVAEREAIEEEAVEEKALQVGDAVTLQLPAKTLNRSAVRAYLFPLLGLLFGALLGQWLVQWLAPQTIGEGGAIVGGLVGVVLVLLYNRNLNNPYPFKGRGG